VLKVIARVAIVAVTITAVSVLPAAAAPINDNFAAALSLSVPGFAQYNSAGATTEPAEPLPCLTGATVWYKFTAPYDARLYVTTTTTDPNPDVNGYFDTVLAVYSGDSLPNLQQLGCNDDTPGGASLRSSLVLINRVWSGQTYYMQVGGYQGRSGNFQLHISLRRNTDATPCGGTTLNWGSVACKEVGGLFQDPKQDGLQATWASNTLNISNDAARSGNFIAQAIWFFDGNCGATCPHWLEIGDTAGTGRMENHQNFWERWWYWVDGSNGPDVPYYREHGIDISPNDGVSRTYIIQWEPTELVWGLYICPGSCIREGSAPWVSPASMGSQFEEVGLEVSRDILNTNSNSAIFLDSRMMTRQYQGGWGGWSSSSVNVQIDAGCGFGYPSNYCLNGIWNQTPPPYDNWRNDKP
jgi:hypothetical protein